MVAMTSGAKSAEEYLAELPDDRRGALTKVREVILANLPEGFHEGILYGLIGYYVPLEIYPVKNGVPLSYIGLASQKHYMAVYLMQNCYQDNDDDWFRKAYLATGKKLDMGKGCVRFKKLEDLPLDLIAQAVRNTTMADFVAEVERGKRAK